MMRKCFAVVAFAALLLLSMISVQAQTTDRIGRTGSQTLVRVNYDGSITVNLDSGKSVNLVPQAELPSVCKDGDLSFKAHVGLHDCVDGSWKLRTSLGSLTGLVKGNGAGSYSGATANTDYVNPAGVQASQFNTCQDAGANDSYACALAPAITSYSTGQVVWFKANTANTGAATINLNSLGAKTIKKNKDADLADGDIKAGQWVAAQYDGTNFQMLSPVSNSGGGSITLSQVTDVTSTAAEVNALHGVKRYVALISQSGTDDPTAIVLENTLGGTPTFGRDEPGEFYMNLTGAFPPTKTVIIMSPDANGGTANGDGVGDYILIHANGFDGVLNKRALIILVYP